MGLQDSWVISEELILGTWIDMQHSFTLFWKLIQVYEKLQEVNDT